MTRPRDAAFSRLAKAEDADVIVYAKETRGDAPNFYVTTTAFGEGKRISDVGKIEQQHVASVDCPLDAGNQRHTTRLREGSTGLEIELTVVKGDRQRLISLSRRRFDQLKRVVGNQVVGVVTRMRMQLGLQHRVPRT